MKKKRILIVLDSDDFKILKEGKKDLTWKNLLFQGVQAYKEVKIDESSKD